ncbi:MAG TPA: glycosyltransferase family 2 protein [Gemmatimonadales bacterium]|nr:glycosyltransferase family 2 protein [Gemmatimonadales bacterium]
MSLLAWGMLGVLLVIAGLGLDVVLGFRKLERLADAAPREGAGAPLVSIVVAARDEARGIEAAARSLLTQRYPAFEIVAVDDRSTDATGEILERLARADPRLRVIHVRELPKGWLGKNHGLSVGAAAARGEWLLFTDADVVMAPETLARAVGFAERRGLDHLAVLPDIRLPGLLLSAFGTGFICWGTAILRPWKARDPRSWRFVGIGAFNLVRAAAYRRAGGHEPIRLRPDDDLKLGKILKRSGARSDFLLGKGLISVEWYHSVPEAIDGLMKNTFSVVEYRLLPMLAGVPLYLVGGLGPLAAFGFGSGPLRWIAAAAVTSQLGIMLFGTRESGAPRRVALLYPVVALLFAWIILRALVLNLAQRGIVWRGTFYPLAELRRNKV